MSLRTHTLTTFCACAVVATAFALTENMLAGGEPDARKETPVTAPPHVLDTRIESLTSRISTLRANDSMTLLRLRVPVQSSALSIVAEEMPDHTPARPGDIHAAERTLAEIGSLAQAVATRHRAVDMLPTLEPCRGIFTSPFGVRVHPISGKVKMHEGMDLSAPTGTPIYASGDGVVAWAERKGGYGNTVILDHGLGYQTLYGHTSKMLVRAGDTVKRGQIIALVGTTGASTGPHLHFEVWVDGIKVDPSGFMQEQLPELPKPAAAAKVEKKAKVKVVACSHNHGKRSKGRRA